MRPRDFLLMVLVCIVWASNNIVSKIVVGHWHVPPIFFAAARFAIVMLVTLPWLRPIPKNVPRVMIIGLLMGALNFGLLFIGFQTVSPSVASVIIQAGVPFTTLLSVIILRERIAWRRGLGIAVSLGGVLLVVGDAAQFQLSWGVVLITASAFGSALGAVLMKQVDDVGPLHFQAWVGVVSFPLLGLASALFEQGQWAVTVSIGWPLIGAVLFTALIVSVFAHTAFYFLIQNHDANLIVPLTLMNPLFTFGLGAMLTGDRFDLQMIIGAALALLGVVLIAVRSKHMPALMIEREQS